EILGVKLADDEYIALLRKARHDVQDGRVLVAPYRINVLSWVDIAEDIAIMKGYNDLPREPPPIITAGRKHKIEIASEDARRALSILGFQEVMNGVLAYSALFDAFGFTYPRVKNPVSERLDAVRPSILPELLLVAAALKRPRFKLFEVGDVIVNGVTRRAVAIAIGGEGVTITDGISAVNALCSALGVNCRVENWRAPWSIEGRCVKVGGDISGYVGEVKPEILVGFEVFTPLVLGELLL
ncbi:MAG: phenylalanine--tRNA ligase subunit beta, partial [Thermoproteus sp.]